MLRWTRMVKLRPKVQSKGLHTEANAQNGLRTHDLANRLHEATGVLRQPGAWRENDRVRRFQNVQGTRIIVPNDLHRIHQRLQAVHQVVGERIQIIENSDAHAAKVLWLVGILSLKGLRV